jgi:hypothetical protein
MDEMFEEYARELAKTPGDEEKLRKALSLEQRAAQMDKDIERLTQMARERARNEFLKWLEEFMGEHVNTEKDGDAN